MATGRSIRVTLLGERTNPKFEGEVWQTGISFVDGSAGGVFPGAIRQALPDFDVTVVGDAEASATWNIDWAWHGSDKLTKAVQRGIADDALGFFNAFKAKVPTDSRLIGVKIQAFDVFGKTIGGSNWFTLKTPAPGSGTAGTQTPPQIAVVASLRTGARGPGGRGRMYLPANACQPTSGTMGSADRTTLVNAVSDFAEGVRARGPLAAVVNTNRQQYSAVTTVTVGDLFDTQRRRRNNADEVYTTRALIL